jgi:hypothetical protein
MERSSKSHSSDHNGLPGGSNIAWDVSCPMRMVVRCIDKPTDQLWHKGSNHLLFRPKDLHITHFCIYAVGPQFVHSHLMRKHLQQVTPATLPSGSQMSVFEQRDISLCTSCIIAASVANSPEESERYPLFGRMVVEKDEDTAPMNHEFYEHKGLIQRWTEGNRTNVDAAKKQCVQLLNCSKLAVVIVAQEVYTAAAQPDKSNRIDDSVLPLLFTMILAIIGGITILVGFGKTLRWLWKNWHKLRTQCRTQAARLGPTNQAQEASLDKSNVGLDSPLVVEDEVILAEAVGPPVVATTMPSAATRPHVVHECKTTTTSKTSMADIATCIDNGHQVRHGHNQHSVFITCKTCSQHATWLYKQNDVSFRRHTPTAELIGDLWDKGRANYLSRSTASSSCPAAIETDRETASSSSTPREQVRKGYLTRGEVIAHQGSALMTLHQREEAEAQRKKDLMTKCPTCGKPIQEPDAVSCQNCHRRMHLHLDCASTCPCPYTLCLYCMGKHKCSRDLSQRY